MPTKRRRVSRARIPDRPDESTWLYLTDRGKRTCLRGRGGDATLWARWRGVVLESWVREHPGTRPRLWWEHDAPRQPAGRWPGRWFDGTLPEPRRRLGGTGTETYEVLAYVPRFERGVPVDWVLPWMVDYYNGRAKDVHGRPIGTEHKEGDFAGVAITRDDQPVFESQAGYLERHGLLLPGERQRLGKADFEPEPIGTRP